MIKQTETGYLIIGDFPVVDYDYYFREIGIKVSLDGEDKLFSYDNCGDDAAHIVVSTGNENTEKRIRISVNLSDVDTITAVIDSVLYVDYLEYKNTVMKLEEGKITAVGGDISTTISEIESVTGDYPEIKSGATTKSILGTIAMWLNNLKSNKVDIAAGDISETKVISFEPSTAGYPIPAAGDTTKVSWGKVKKFFEDMNNLRASMLFIGSIVNNCVTSNSALPLSAAQGKVLMDMITQLNSDLTTGLASKAATSHASTGTGYGLGNASNYGHVKVSDNYTSSAGAASAGVAASSAAVYNAYAALLSGKAASNHTHDDRYYTESEIDTKLGSLVKVINVTAASTTVAANDGMVVYISAPTQSGYTVAGVVGHNSNNNNLVATQITLSGTTIRLDVKNVSSSSITCTPSVQLIYIKNL